MLRVGDDSITREISGTRMVTLTENPSSQINPVKQDGSNYNAWSCLCKLLIKACGLEIRKLKLEGRKAG